MLPAHRSRSGAVAATGWDAAPWHRNATWSWSGAAYQVGPASPGWCLAGVLAPGAGRCRGQPGEGSAGISAYESLSVKCP